MKESIKTLLLYLGVILLPVGILIGAAVSGQIGVSEYVPPISNMTPLKEKVRKATRFREIDAALAEGYRQGPPCVSGFGAGATEVRFLQADRIADGVLSVEAPEALIYEPMPGGAMRLVGVEFIEIARDWESRNPDGSPPSLDGNLLNLVGAPNRFGLPAFYELHVWVREDRPQESFAVWNTRVTCDAQLGD
jgi:hypothetical protein